MYRKDMGRITALGAILPRVLVIALACKSNGGTVSRMNALSSESVADEQREEGVQLHPIRGCLRQQEEGQGKGSQHYRL